MSEPLPIACTLSAADLRARGEELRTLGGDGLVDATEEPGRAVLRFRPDPLVRQRVEATVLTISAPNGGAEMIHELAAALAGR